jgi:dTDP-4-amino-4,6-dideoxygalactose transaminase
MVLSRDSRLLSTVRDLRDYDERRRHRLRFNYKLTDFQAALGRSQLGRLPAMLRRRSAIAARYQQAWRALFLHLPAAPPGSTHAFHRFVLSSGRTAAGLARALRALGVVARPPVFQPLHRVLGLEGFPGATESFRAALSVPIYPGLTAPEEARVRAAVRRVLG